VKSTPNLEARGTFVNEATSLLRTLRAFEEIDPGPEEEKLLRRLIREIRRFLQGGDLERVLQQIRTRKANLPPSTGGAVVDEFSKLAHYRTVSRTLYEKSVTLEVFRFVRVDKIRPCSEMFYKPPAKVTPNLARVLRGYQVDNAGQKKLTRIYQKRGRSNVDPTVSFVETVKRTLTSGKIHAEVQILSYYEESKANQRPRVIASSKDACFLCNALFSLYDCYHLPRSHGTLYTGWLLPTNLATSHELPNRLDELIRKYNKRAIVQLLSNERGERHPNPNESTIFLQPSGSVSSLADSMLSVAAPSQSLSSATTISQNNSLNERQNTRTDINIPKAIGEETTPLSSKSELSKVEASSSSTVESSNSSDREPRSCGIEIKGQPTTPTTSARLSQGEAYSISLLPDNSSARIYTDFLELFLEWPGKSKALSATPGTMVIDVEWLSTSSTSDLDPVTPHDVYGLSTETETICRSSGEVLLRVGDQVVRLNRR
jgi:hypothetical protein